MKTPRRSRFYVMVSKRLSLSTENRAVILRALNSIHRVWEMHSEGYEPVEIWMTSSDFGLARFTRIDSILTRLTIDGLLIKHRSEDASYLILCNEDFKTRYKRYIKRLGTPYKEPIQTSCIEIPSTFNVNLRDRAILINEHLLSTPYGEGKNMAFFEYCFKNPNTNIDRISMPENVRKEIRSKLFTKIINELGFKEELRKAFFPSRSKSGVYFRNPVSVLDLKNEGIDPEIIVRMVELENMRHRPK